MVNVMKIVNIYVKKNMKIDYVDIEHNFQIFSKANKTEANKFQLRINCCVD